MHKLFLISGPSGSGKTTLMHRVMDNEIVSVTTRTMRDGERAGFDYYFISPEEYEGLLTRGELVERSTYAGNRYGVTRAELEEKLSKGPAFCIVDHPGMLAMSKVYIRTVRIFVYAHYDACYLNMRDRGADAESIFKRLSTHNRELENSVDYDYVIRNVRGKFDDTAGIIRHIVNAENGV